MTSDKRLGAEKPEKLRKKICYNTVNPVNIALVMLSGFTVL